MLAVVAFWRDDRIRNVKTPRRVCCGLSAASGGVAKRQRDSLGARNCTQHARI
jgi:hypothetical protein